MRTSRLMAIAILFLASGQAARRAPAEQLVGTFREVKIRYTAGCLTQPNTISPETVSSSASGSDTKSLSCHGSSGSLTVSWSVPATTPSVEARGSFCAEWHR